MDLELNIISATDLKKSNHFSSKIQPYVVVSISGANVPAQKTPIDADGGGNPNWNHPLTFSVAGAGDLTLKFQIRSRRNLAADKLIGEVRVPLRDLLTDAAAGKTPAPARFVSYQVKKPSGRAKGVLTFSYRFSHKISGYPAPEVPQTTGAVYPAPADIYPPPPKPAQTATGYPAVEGYRHDVYPPPTAAIPGKGQISYGYPTQGAYGDQYQVQTGYGYPVQAGYGLSSTYGSG